MQNNIKSLTIGGDFPEEVNAVIEIPKGSNQKYEYDEPTGDIKLDRVLHSSLSYPASYGFIPETRAEDGDHLDVLVLTNTFLDTGSVLTVRPIGMMAMEDGMKVDNKIIAFAVDDTENESIQDISDLSGSIKKEITYFFQHYKELEEKVVIVGKWLDKASALGIIKRTNNIYLEETKDPKTNV